jgi:hypothetical protein
VIFYLRDRYGILKVTRMVSHLWLLEECGQQSKIKPP